MRRKNQKSFGVDIDSTLADEFSDQYESRGQKKFRALEGALRLWLTLSPREQTDWINGKPMPVYSGNQADNEIFQDLAKLADDFAAVTEKIQKNESARKKGPQTRKQGEPQ